MIDLLTTVIFLKKREKMKQLHLLPQYFLGVIRQVKRRAEPPANFRFAYFFGWLL